MSLKRMKTLCRRLYSHFRVEEEVTGVERWAAFDSEYDSISQPSTLSSIHIPVCFMVCPPKKDQTPQSTGQTDSLTYRTQKSILLLFCHSLQALLYMQVVVNVEEYKSLIFPKQSLLLWPISTPCFQVLITALLDCQLREAEREKERTSARGEGSCKK